jgi:hypothetical protein
MSQQFCIKKTPEESKKEMEDITKREIEKLAEQIKANPSILKRNKYNYDSESDDSTVSSSDSSDSSDSSSSRSHYKSKINKSAIDICKKELVIDKLEEKNYFKTLEMNNLILENSHLKDENTMLSLKIKELELQSKIISHVIELSCSEPLKVVYTNLTESNMNSKMMQIQKEFDKYNTQISKLITDLNSLSDSVIKAHYNQELAKINITLNKNYEFNNKLVDKFILKVKNREKCNLIMMFMLITFMLLFIKDYAMNYMVDIFDKYNYTYMIGNYTELLKIEFKKN